MSVRRYRVTTEREGWWWLFGVDELGAFGRAASLAEAEREAHAAAAAWLDVEPSTISVIVTVSDAADELSEWEAASAAEAEARLAVERAAVRRRAVVGRLRARGFSGVDTSYLLGISQQRVSQLARGADAQGST